MISRTERRLLRYRCADTFNEWMLSRVSMACYGGKSPAPPDYTPLANASADSAKIMAGLGQQQLDFAKQQYTDNLPTYQKLVNQQMNISDQSQAQANDYYNYMKDNQRPVEQSLNTQAMAAGSPGMQETAAGQAMADARTGYTGALGTAVREGARYGWSPEKMATAAGATGLGFASAEASAANAARQKQIDLGYAKKLDVAGLYRGLPGASTAAYGLAVDSGNSAARNQVAPGQQYQNGMSQGIQTIGNGRSMLTSGLSGAINGQAGIYGAQSQQAGQEAAGMGSAVGAGIGLYAAVAI